MRKGKRFIENENLIIYVGTAIFIILAIAVGIVMYMTTKTNNEDSAEKIANENQNEVIEDVNSSIGKTVEEQEEIIAKTENTVKTTETTTSQENTIKTDNTTVPIIPFIAVSFPTRIIVKIIKGIFKISIVIPKGILNK